MRGVPFWAQALALCALFAIVGVAILGDSRKQGDAQRQIAIANVEYIATGDISELSQAKDIAYRYYGMAFEMPLLLAERGLGLQDPRHIFLTRHLLTHLFFIAGGFVCGMLAYRTLGSRWVALLAMLMFLLHPRLYAHSFFNTKDIPFAVTLLIALYLTRRAFRRDTLGAFLLCGVVVGLAINLRPFALMLPPMILAMRGLDLRQASGGGERKRILASAGIFAAAALATAYIIHPYYWENPLRFIEGLRAQSQHPFLENNLFMGEIHPSDAVPWNFIPAWFAITAPPVALALGAVGCAAACWQGMARPLDALRDREIRFGVLLLGCFALPVAVAIILQSNLYSGWRQMYFLWAPFCLLAAVGLDRLANNSDGAGIWKIGARLPGWVRGGRLRRTLAYGAAGIGLITTLAAMAALHPHQQVYFNALVDTKTPGALGKMYEMDYGSLTQRQLLEYLLARYPDDTLRVWPENDLARVLPQSDRDRLISLENPHAADFYLARDSLGHPLFREHPLFRKNSQDYYLHPFINVMDILEGPAIHAVRGYGSRVAYVVARDVDAYRAAYDDVAANGTSLARSDFDIYAYDGALYYLSADCPPPVSSDADFRVFLHIIPTDPADLPADGREHGYENRDFSLEKRAAFFDGKCIHRQPLPDYPIARISTGHTTAGGGAEWRADIGLAAQALYESIAAGDYGKPVAQSHFDLYLRDNALIYIKEPCAAGDAEARFFLHITPADPADLPTASRERGFANLDFQFSERGAYAGDICVASIDLPDYAIERIRTGQFVSGEGDLWRAEFSVAR